MINSKIGYIICESMGEPSAVIQPKLFNGKAVAQLLLTVLTCGMLSFVSSIWGLIEGILILTGTIKEDAEGKPLGE